MFFLSLDVVVCCAREENLWSFIRRERKRLPFCRAGTADGGGGCLCRECVGGLVGKARACPTRMGGGGFESEKNQWSTTPSCPVSHDECCPVEIYGCQSPPLGTVLYTAGQHAQVYNLTKEREAMFSSYSSDEFHPLISSSNFFPPSQNKISFVIWFFLASCFTDVTHDSMDRIQRKWTIDFKALWIAYLLLDGYFHLIDTYSTYLL